MGKRCRSCDVENVDEAKFCLQCGSSLSDETPPMRSDIAPHVACAACGHINVELSAFCSECGEHLESPTPRAPGRKAFAVPPRFARPLAAAVVIVVAALLVGGVSSWIQQASNAEQVSGWWHGRSATSSALAEAKPAGAAPMREATSPEEEHSQQQSKGDTGGARYSPEHAASVSATQSGEPSVTPVPANAKRTAAVPEMAGRKESPRQAGDEPSRGVQNESAPVADVADPIEIKSEQTRPRKPPTAHVATASARSERTTAVPGNRTAKELCAHQTNFIARSVCEGSECQKAVHQDEAMCRTLTESVQRKANSD